MAVQFGFVDIEHLFDRPVQDVGYGVIRDAIDRTLAFYNRRLDNMMRSLAVPTVLAQERFLMPGGGSLQPMDEDSNPLPTLQYEGYDVGYPIRWGGDAMGTNRLSRAFMTVEEANNKTRDAQLKDKNFLIHHMIAALLTKTSYTWLDRTRLGYTGAGSLTIQPLANGDATTYIKGNGASLGTDDHYRGFASAIDDTNNPFDTIRQELTEHVDNPDGPVTVYAATNLIPDIRDLTDFLEVLDPRIQPGANQDVLRGGIDKGFGDYAWGRVNRCNIIEWAKLPNDYMLAVLDGTPPLAMRQYPLSGFQGLFTEENNLDGNHMETRFIRAAGFGVRNRVSAVAAFIGNATYPSPASYTAPLAVA
jgi:hypothetical protein